MAFMVGSAVMAVFAAWLAYGLAERKGRSPWGWAVASLILIVPVLVLAVLPSKRPVPGEPVP